MGMQFEVLAILLAEQLEVLVDHTWFADLLVSLPRHQPLCIGSTEGGAFDNPAIAMQIHFKWFAALSLRRRESVPSSEQDRS